MVLTGKAPRKMRTAVLGLTFKENCPDIRNSKVMDIINVLREYGVEPVVSDPWASEVEAMRTYGVRLTGLDEIRNMDCILVAVAHSRFAEQSLAFIDAMFSPGRPQEKVLIDVKGMLDREEVAQRGYRYWRL